jgi:hypothetical protein
VVIRLTDRARAALRADEVVLIDWHRAGLCCSDAGEVSVRSVRRARLPRRVRPADGSPDGVVFAHPLALPLLQGHQVTVDCRRVAGWRRFRTDLPPDAGLRSCLGLTPAPAQAARSSPVRSH